MLTYILIKIKIYLYSKCAKCKQQINNLKQTSKFQNLNEISLKNDNERYGIINFGKNGKKAKVYNNYNNNFLLISYLNSQSMHVLITMKKILVKIYMKNFKLINQT